MKAFAIKLASACAAAAVAVCLTAAAPAPPTPPIHQGAQATSPGLSAVDTSIPGVTRMIKNLKAEGRKVVSGSTVKMVAVTPTAAATNRSLTPNASTDPPPLPAGCYVTVVLTRSNHDVESSSLVYCNKIWTRVQDSAGIQFYAFLNWGNTAKAPVTAGSNTPMQKSFTHNVHYTCVNNNQTSFQTISHATVWYGQTQYVGSNRDELDDQPCGTS